MFLLTTTFRTECRLTQIDGAVPEWVEVFMDSPGEKWAWWIGQLCPPQAPGEIFRVRFPYYEDESDVIFHTMDQHPLRPLHYRCRNGVMHAIEDIDTFSFLYYR